MSTHADKTQKNKSRAVANVISQNQSHGESAIQFVDNRTEASVLKSLKDMADDSLRGHLSTQLRAMNNQHGSPNQIVSGLEEKQRLHEDFDLLLRQKGEALAPGKFDTVQRLAMKYGDKAPIPQDAEKIAASQDVERGVNISAQSIPGDIAEGVYSKMEDEEKLYVVAHGRAPIGNEPAILQEGDGSVLTGAQVAEIINNVKTGLVRKGKSIGEVKIEACMSLLSRKTKSGIFGETFVESKPSLLTSIKSSLLKTYNVHDIVIKGNLGFSTGNELEEEGVQNLSPANTELGLLVSVLEILYDAPEDEWDSTKNAALKKDGLNILRKFGSRLEKFDNDTQVGELIDLPSAKFAKSYLSASRKLRKFNGGIINMAILLSGYIRTDPAE
jgi:hypothetical protein